MSASATFSAARAGGEGWLETIRDLLCAVVLVVLIMVLIGLPTFFSSLAVDDFQLSLSPSAGETPVLPQGQQSFDGHSFHCSGLGSADSSSARLRCRSISDDSGSLAALTRGLETSGWRIDGDILTESSLIGSPLFVMIAVTFMILGAAFLLRNTHGGWGFKAALRTGWRLPLLVLAPLAMSALLGTAAAHILLVPEYFPPDASAVALGDFSDDLPVAWIALAGSALFVLAAIPEEAVFRGWLHERLFSRHRHWLAYLIITKMFVLAHAPMLFAAGTAPEASWWSSAIYALGLTAISLVLTWIRRRFGSVVLCVAGHALHNAVLFTGLFVASNFTF